MFRPLRDKKNGFSIVEVIVAAMIFAFVAIGIISMTSSIRPKATISERKVGAALVAKMYLDWLRGKVDASTYNDGYLAVGYHVNSYTLGSVTYNISYVVTNDTETGGRNINMLINWLEPEF